VIPYSPLEAGVAGVTQTVPGAASGDMAVNNAKKILKGKADSLLPQIKKLAMSARILNKEELIKLFFDEYNEGTIQPEQAEEGIKDPLIHPKQ
jgi:hypothetical protein